MTALNSAVLCVFAACTVHLSAAQLDPLSALDVHATQGAAAGYVADTVCATCHAQKYESYQHVGMAQSFKRPAAAAPMEDFGAEYYHAPSQRYYQIFERNDGLQFRRYQRDQDGAAINEIEIPVAWVLGSGNRARSYLYQTEWGELYLLPLGWYSETNSWGMSPGFEDADHPGIHRRVQRKCMFCHNAFPEVAERRDAHWAVETFPLSLPEGTGCQRCHGPGADHINTLRDGGDIASIRDAIVNPRRLSAELRDAVCFQCHMLPAVSMFGARRFGRSDYSFRPGQKLSDYLVHVDIVERGVDPADRFEINHHGYRLFQSRCYRQSKGELACISCHDPHVKPESAAFRASVGLVCAGCHEDPSEHHAPGVDLAGGACVTCHMPRRRTRDVIHVTMTDHRIAKGPFDLDALIEPLEKETRAIAEFRLLELGDPPSGDTALTYRLVTALRAGRSVQAALRALEQVLQRTEFADPTPYLDLARSQLQVGRFEAAEATARRLVAADKDLHVAYALLGVALVAQNRGRGYRRAEAVVAAPARPGNALQSQSGVSQHG